MVGYLVALTRSRVTSALRAACLLVWWCPWERRAHVYVPSRTLGPPFRYLRFLRISLARVLESSNPSAFDPVSNVPIGLVFTARIPATAPKLRSEPPAFALRAFAMMGFPAVARNFHVHDLGLTRRSTLHSENGDSLAAPRNFES